MNFGRSPSLNQRKSSGTESGKRQRTTAHATSRFCRASFVIVLEVPGSNELEKPWLGGVPAGVETGIRLASPDAVAAHQQLRPQGGRRRTAALARSPPMFAIHDPDGNGLEIVQEVN